MKYIVGCLSLVWLCLVTTPSATAEETCDCPKLACDPCSFEKGVTFFAGKCGPDNSKVKSCARPTCIAIEVATEKCPNPPAASTTPRPPVVVKAAGVPQESAADPVIIPSVGRVKVLQGSVAIVHADGKTSTVTKEEDLREGDRIDSGKDGAALVAFEGGNKVHVHADTALEIKEFKDPKIEESRRALLHLIKGKIRNQVEQKYNGKTSYYRVQTKGAVAGVRGTDFVIEHHEDDRLETKVETLGGRVMLASLDEKQAVEIVRGEGAKFVADLPDPSFRDKDYSDFIKRGSLSPVYKIPEDRLKELESSSRVDVARNRKAPVKESAICEKPKAFFNQCVWVCHSNPAGESKCRTDITGVRCTRQRCNANGKWSDETVLSGGLACPAKGELVKDCDY